MGWDAWLAVVGPTKDHALAGADWNYTYNTEPMIRAALEHVDSWRGPTNFWAWLGGQTADVGKIGLEALVAELERDPDRYRALNPVNGYGDYDGLVKILREMAAAAGEAPPGVVWRLSL